MHAVGMTDTELIAGERVDQSQRAWFQTLYRYDLTRLAEYAVEL
jgi:hypothetical protein